MSIMQGLGANSSIYINEFAIAQLDSTDNHTSTIGASHLQWLQYRQSGTITIKTISNGAGDNGSGVNSVTISNRDNDMMHVGGTNGVHTGTFANTKVVITGTGSYSGNTTVSGHGILILDSEADLSASGTIQVQANSVLIHNADKTVGNLSWESGGLIGGNGTFAQATFIGSGTHFINPGDIDGGIGKLNFSEAAYTWGGAGTELVYDWDFSDPTLGAGFDYDQLIFAGDLTLSADSYTLNLIGQGGATLDGFTGELAILTAAGTLSADLDNWNAVLPSGFELKLSDDGHSLLLSNIPEPSTWLLLGTGVALLAFLRRRR
ncbi:MAG: PEP-CTERM sorting domain-containing protein [Verrucomicrobiales bacterium]|nr:PEP-CTERM sorting domain-containing protein [Verrucomicrobiales bacterium]